MTYPGDSQYDSGYSEEDDVDYATATRTYTTILKIVCGLAIIADIILIFIILKFKKLRAEVHRVCVLNWCFVNAVFLLTTCLRHVDVDVSFVVEGILEYLNIDICSLMLSGQFLILLWLSLKWLKSDNSLSKLNNLSQSLRDYLTGVYAVMVVALVASVIWRADHLHIYSVQCATGLAYSVLIVAVVVNYINYFKRSNDAKCVPDNEFPLLVPAVGMAVWLPYTILYALYANNLLQSVTLQHFLNIFAYLGMSNSILYLFAFSTRDKTFKGCFQYIFGCRIEPYAGFDTEAKQLQAVTKSDETS